MLSPTYCLRALSLHCCRYFCWLPGSIVLIIGIGADHAFAQASLAAENVIEDIKIDGTKDTYTVIRDAARSEQWYYMPNSPRLYERQNGNKVEPEFTLLRYQFEDIAKPGQTLEGGILQFAATLAAPPETLTIMKQAISQQKSIDPANIRLAAMPLKTAKVDLYAPTGALISSEPFGAGVAPIHSSQKMVFSIDLTNKGADVYNALVKSKTGVPVRVEFTYLGLTPPAGFQVKVDWSKSFSHYSKDSEFRARASYFGLVGASASVSAKEIRERLESDKAIEVSVIQGENFDMNQIDKYLQPVVKRINDELLEAMKPPTQIDPAKATEPDAGGFFGGAGYSVATKNINLSGRGTETFKFNVQSITERKTIAGGFININKYLGDEDLVKQLIITASLGFRTAYLILPEFGTWDFADSVQVDLGIKEVGKEMIYNTRSARWRPGKAWVPVVNGVEGKDPTLAIMFPLTTLDKAIENVPSDKLRLVARVTVTSRTQDFNYEKELALFTGNRTGAINPRDAADVVLFDGSYLPWKRVTPAEKLDKVVITLRSGPDQYDYTLKAKLHDGKYFPPDPLAFLIPKPSNASDPLPIIPTITYKFIGRNDLPWEYNGQDLRSPRIGFDISLDPSKWPPQ